MLSTILKNKRAEVTAAMRRTSFEELHRRAQAVATPVASLAAALRARQPAIVAEFKRKSPSKGVINATADVRTVVQGYARAGAAAVSVLTDRDFFGGSLGDLTAARAATTLPLLRKDFIIDRYQLCEARLAGADAVLLIAAALAPIDCAELAAFAASLGLEVLLELHDEDEVAYINPHVSVVGVNNRCLSTFTTDTATSRRLAAALPATLPRISESGIAHPRTVRELHEEAGYHGFLMGETFMKEADPAAALAAFLQHLRTP